MSGHLDNSTGLPQHLHDLFWEYDTSQLDWEEHRDFIVRRVLSAGTWDQIQWLRREVGDIELRRVIEDSAGRDLSPRQLRFWQLIIGLRKADVDRWLESSSRQIWDQRA